jgi:hypothetical protein
MEPVHCREEEVNNATKTAVDSERIRGVARETGCQRARCVIGVSHRPFAAAVR